MSFKFAAAVVTWSLLASAAAAQSPTPAATPVPEYGMNVTLEQARIVRDAAEVVARRNHWPVAIAVVDTAGNLVLFERSDNTQTASLRLAVDKAVSAATYRRPTRYFQEAVGLGGERLGILMLPGASASEGGIPLSVGGKIVGAIGVSGVAAGQDNQIATAGAAALK